MTETALQSPPSAGPPSTRVLVIGGGIAGLATAYEIIKKDNFEITILESSDRWGGMVGTTIHNGLVVDAGPDSIFTMKPWAIDLMRELGLEDQFISPRNSEFSILVKGKLHRVPRAFAAMMPTAAGALEKAGFLSSAAKQRILGGKSEPIDPNHDISIAEFFRRKFGRQFTQLVAEPLMAGIYSGDPERLSMQALYPSFLGIKSGDSDSATNSKPGFIGLRGGMGQLVDRLLERLSSAELHLNSPVTRISLSGGGVIVESGERAWEADQVVLATPASVASMLLADLSPEASQALSEIRQVSTSIATLAYPSDRIETESIGNGYLVPYSEHSAACGCTISSSKWEVRAPEGTTLVRVFMGREPDMVIDEMSDNQLLERAKSAVRDHLKATAEPTFTHLTRWTKLRPQYELGHVERVNRAVSALEGIPISLVGGAYRGSGIPDCVRQAQDAARKITESALS